MCISDKDVVYDFQNKIHALFFKLFSVLLRNNQNPHITRECKTHKLRILYYYKITSMIEKDTHPRKNK